MRLQEIIIAEMKWIIYLVVGDQRQSKEADTFMSSLFVQILITGKTMKEHQNLYTINLDSREIL